MENNSRDIALEQKIDAYIKGELSEEEVEQLWVELLKKPEYISLLETEIDIARLYKAEEEEAGSTFTLNYWKWLAAAAAVVLLAISINFFSTSSQDSLQQWAQDSINLSQNLASAQVTRSSTKISTADSLLNAGYKAAIEGSTEKALSIFEGILKQYEESSLQAKVYLNLGMLQYNAGEYAASIDNFKQAITVNENADSLLEERSYWYMGHAFIQTKQFKQAREAIEQTYTSGQIYKKEALKMLERLKNELKNLEFNQGDQPENESK